MLCSNQKSDYPAPSPMLAKEPASFTQLPTELWLQILEAVSDPEHLWTTVRLVSHANKSYVVRIFECTYLPTLSVSLSLPRHHPTTGSLRYPGAVPGAELTFRYAELDGNTSRLVLATPTRARDGDTMEQLNDKGVLCKTRLDEASACMWFGRNRGKGACMDIRKDVCWDQEKKVWSFGVEWNKLISAYFAAKSLGRHSQLASARPYRRK